MTMSFPPLVELTTALYLGVVLWHDVFEYFTHPSRLVSSWSRYLGFSSVLPRVFYFEAFASAYIEQKEFGNRERQIYKVIPLGL